MKYITKITLQFCIMLLGVLAFAVNDAMATRAIPEVVEVKQPDGSIIKIKIHGDEFFNYSTTEDGYIVAQDSQGFYCYANYSPMGVNISQNRVGQGTSAFGALGRSKTIDAATANIIRDRNINKRQINNLAAFNATPDNYNGASNGKYSKVLVLLVEFKDIAFVTPNPQDAFTRMLNQQGYSENGGTGSAKDYFADNSMNAFSPDIEVFGIIKLSKSHDFYGGNDMFGMDANPRTMVVEACRAAVSMGLDISKYDTDNDGTIDNVFIYYAGHNEAEGGPSSTIWPHRWAVSDGSSVGGYRIYDYACTSELKGSQGATMAGIGTFCHEFGHVLGLPDLYDTDGMMGGAALTMDHLSIMSSGNYNNLGRTPPYYSAIEREFLGWLEPTVISNDGSYTIEPINTNVAYKYNTSNSGEYFLFECRTDKKWDQYLMGQGMLVYHIDKSNNVVGGLPAYKKWLLSSNSVNNVANHQCADLIEASGVEDPRANPASLFFPGSRQVYALSSFTKPSSIKEWNNKNLDINITNIERRSTGEITMSVSFEPSGVLYGRILDSDKRSAVANATVILSRILADGDKKPQYMQYVAKTNEMGQYVVPAITVGKYNVIVQCAGYLTNAVDAFDIGLGNNLLDIQITKGDGVKGIASAVYQRMIRLDWSIVQSRINLGAINAEPLQAHWRAVGDTEYLPVSAIDGEPMMGYIAELKPANAYEIKIVDASLSEVYKEIVITNDITSKFIQIDQIKNDYKIGDIVELSLANASALEVGSTQWIVNGEKLPMDTRYFKLNGNAVIQAHVANEDGSVTKIEKRVFVK